MERKFKNKEVADFFNEHFINYRVNMQNPSKANQLRKRYDIVFLPTMLIVDPNGVIKYQVDRELSISELLNMGQKAMDPGTYFISESTAVRRNTNNVVVSKPVKPFNTPNAKIDTEKAIAKNKENQKSSYPPAKEVIATETDDASSLDDYEAVDESSQKILKVLGKGELPPEVLLQEAYRKLENMDGSHKQAAKDYLATQTNWNTETNRKFILDFINNASSKEYDFLIKNKPKFIEQFGQKVVTKTLEIITYRALYNAVPRPSLEETIDLYTNLGVKEPERKSYHYFISRLITDDKADAVVKLGDDYLSFSPKDHEVQYLIARYLTYRSSRTDENLRTAKTLLNSALELRPNSVIYLDLMGRIYSDLGDNNKSIKVFQKAKDQAIRQGIEYQSSKSTALNG